MAGTAKVQHYVPQFLLRNFGTGKKDRLHVFDKQTGQVFVTNARNVAAESRFYDFESEGRTVTVEPGLERLESISRPIIHRLLEANTLAALATEDRAKLSVFFSIQFMRTPYFRENWCALPAILGEWLRRKANSEEELAAVAEYIRVPDENETTRETVHFMLTNAAQFAEHFLDKTWVLLRTDRARPFLIGDNPIALQNQLDFGPRGNLGLGVRGIEIYFPLSPARALALWCPSHEVELREGTARIREMSRVLPMLDARVRLIGDMLTAIETGSPLASAPENVENFNSLQIRYAERYVFSSIEDFAEVTSEGVETK